MSAQRVIKNMVAYETDASNGADFRRLIRDQRMALQSAIDPNRVYGSYRDEDEDREIMRRTHIAEVLAETRRVCSMYGIDA